MKSYYLATLSALTILVLLHEAWPFPRFGVSTVASRPDVAGYDRDAFTHWEPADACTTRELALSAQTTLSGCDVVADVYDPYSDEMLAATESIHIDHVFALSAAWDLGAHSWSDERRTEFANDPLNLIATSASLNQEKSDSLPSEWLPPKNRCGYAKRLAEVAKKYELPLPHSDLRMMRKECRFAIPT